MMEFRAGIDLGQHLIHIGIVEKNDYSAKVIATCHLSVDKEHLPQDLADLYDRLLKYLTLYKVERITVERPLVFAGRGFPVLKMAELFTLIKLAANRMELDVVQVTPAQWRKKVLGKGNVPKSKAIAACKEMGWNPDDHNSAEAIMIALY